jgi:hypothetical protein
MAKQFYLERHIARLEPILAEGPRSSPSTHHPDGVSLAIQASKE